MYTLTAQNKSGASITIKANTVKGVLALFDLDYMRSGFQIKIHDCNGRMLKPVKKSFI